MKTPTPLIVQKYGGSSLASPDHIRRVARHVVERKDQGCDLVVVVSAMGKTTDSLVKLGHELDPNPDKREMDMLMSTGEQISMLMSTGEQISIAALALAINALGKYQAVSLTGAQVGILTDSNHSNARILEIAGDRIRHALKQGKIAIIAGFQGVSLDNEITTLGRGGSDTTAVALAAALNADYCILRIRKNRPTPGASTKFIMTTRCRWRRQVPGCCTRRRWNLPNVIKSIFLSGLHFPATLAP